MLLLLFTGEEAIAGFVIDSAVVVAIEVLSASKNENSPLKVEYEFA